MTRPSRIRATTRHPAGHSAHVVAKKLGTPGTTFSSGTTYGISLRAAGSQPGIAAAAPAVAASFINDRLDSPSDIRVPRSVVTDKTIQGGAALGMAIDAKAHVYLVNRDHSVHRLDRPMTGLAGDAGPDVRFMDETYEIRQRVDPVPANFEWRLGIVGPWPRHRLDPAEKRAPVAPDATLNRRHARGLGTPRIFMAVLARNLVDTRMHTMAEGDRLFDIHAGRPRTL